MNTARRRTHDQLVCQQLAGQFLEVLSICQDMQVLPIKGGLLEQDSLFVHLMKFALIFQNERRELDKRKNAKKG